MTWMMSGGRAGGLADRPYATDAAVPAHPWLSRALAACATLIVAAWALLAVVHADDRYHIGWVEGTRIALARAAAGGVLFPPLFDGNAYGGTRFMPGPILLHAGLAQVTGEYLVSGKLLAYCTTLLLLVVMFVLLRRAGCSRSGAAGLAAGVLVTLPGLLAGTTTQGDGLSVVLQLAAVGLILHARSRVSTVGAAACCTLAVVSKLTAVWAPIAIVVWLVARDRRRLPLFAAALIAGLAAAFGLLELLSDGRMISNLRPLAFAGSAGGAGLLRAPMRVLSLVADGAPLVLILFPLAFGALLTHGRRAFSIWLASLIAALVVLVVVMSDSGALHNHVLDLVVVTLIATGDAWARLAPPPGRPTALGVAVGVVILWALTVSFLLEVRPDVEEAAREAFASTPARYEPHPLATELHGRTLLSEDPYIPVSLDREPVVLDAWTFLRLGRDHPSWRAALVARIEARTFDRIVLVYPLAFESWYRDVQFGAPIAAAIRRAYRFETARDGYFVYAPRPARS
jgi:hypothetical protein